MLLDFGLMDSIPGENWRRERRNSRLVEEKPDADISARRGIPSSDDCSFDVFARPSDGNNGKRADFCHPGHAFTV